jgi:hypothetical protein
MEAKELIVPFLGLLFTISAILPLGAYHFIGAADVVGILWNFMIPTGWFSFVLGAVILFRQKIGLTNIGLSYLFLIGGLVLVLLVFLGDDYFLGLWTGFSGNYDVDNRLPVPFWSGVVGVFAGLLLKISPKKKASE